MSVKCLLLGTDLECKLLRRYAINNSKTCKTLTTLAKEDPKRSTVDQDDVNKYTKYSDYWWNGPLEALHAMNKIRVPFVRDGLVERAPDEINLAQLKNKKILDVGCGGGFLSEGLAKIGAEVTGIDANEDMINVARQHCASNNDLKDKPHYQCITIEDHINERKDYYDGLVASEVIEHVNNKDIFVKSCVEAVKPGGKLFFTTLNRTRISQILCIYVAEYFLRLLPRGTHEYEKFIRPDELKRLLEENNCQVEVVYGTMYNCLSRTWSFTRSQRLMYALRARKLETMQSI